METETTAPISGQGQIARSLRPDGTSKRLSAAGKLERKEIDAADGCYGTLKALTLEFTNKFDTNYQEMLTKDCVCEMLIKGWV